MSTQAASEAALIGDGCNPLEIVIRVYGLPAGQGSKRHVGNGRMVESSKRVAPWRSDVMLHSRNAYQGPPLACPVSMEITFWLPRPKSHYRTGRFAGELKPNAPVFAPTVPDIDKLCRSTLDGLSMKSGGAILVDDSQVVTITAQKRYVTEAEGCGAYIRVIESQYDSIGSRSDLRDNAQALVRV